MHGNDQSRLPPLALPNAQPSPDLSVYDPLVPRKTPSAPTKSHAAAVLLENSIRRNIFEFGAFFDANGKEITSKAGTHDRVNFNQVELAGTQGSLFTHNHPNGSAFSGGDVELAVDLKLVEIRAVTTDCRYIMRPESWPDWPTVEGALIRHAAAAKQYVDMLVQNSQLAPIYKDKECQHRLWELVSNELKLGYEREVS